MRVGNTHRNDRLGDCVGWFLLATIVCIAVALSSCIPLPIYSEYPQDQLADRPTLDALIGQKKSAVRMRLGAPAIEVEGERSSFYVYSGASDEVQLLLMVYVPIAAQTSAEGRLYCLLLEFDQDKVLRGHRLEESSSIWTNRRDPGDCLGLFWTEEELTHLRLVKSQGKE